MGPTVLLLLATLAQSSADRESLEALRDSLAGVTDSVALHELEATEADPSLSSAVVDLANTALTQRIRPSSSSTRRHGVRHACATGYRIA